MEEKNKGGRPTKYREEFCNDIIKFFDREPYDVLMINDEDTGNKVPATDKNGNAIMTPSKLPTFEGFAISIGVHRATLIDWCKEHKEFLDAYTRAKDYQKEILMQNGLLGLYEKQFAIFTAKNVTDMTDKQELNHKSSDGSMSPTRIERVIVDSKHQNS